MLRQLFASHSCLSRMVESKLPFLSCAMKRWYHKNVVDHYDNPRNVGSFDKADPKVGTGLVGAPACGDVMKLQIKVDEDGKIVDSCFKTFGCASAIASSSVATEWIKGQTMEKAEGLIFTFLQSLAISDCVCGGVGIKNNEIAEHLSLPPVKLHCSMLAEDAIKAAINDVKQKQRSEEKDVESIYP